MELGLTIPLQRKLRCSTLPFGTMPLDRYGWDLHAIILQGRPSLLAVRCLSRYTFVLFDLAPAQWSALTETFLARVERSLEDLKISAIVKQNYITQMQSAIWTKTHGRREAAFLNRAWEEVLRLDYTVDQSAQEQPLLDSAVNARTCRCAGYEGSGLSAERLCRSLGTEG